MKSNYIQSKFDSIDLLFNYFSSLPSDEFMKSHIAKYLTVLISGIYEDIVKTRIEEYLNNINSDSEVRNYINNDLAKSFRNPDTSNLKGVLKKFSTQWVDRIKSLDSIYTDALDSIVNNKNLIAHGVNCNISYDNIREYFINSKFVIVELDNLLK